VKVLDQLNKIAPTVVVKFNNDPDFLKDVENSSLWRNLPAVAVRLWEK
jgi:ABC-type Fe3+-hydroxamate transport system substrate-binding protein